MHYKNNLLEQAQKLQYIVQLSFQTFNRNVFWQKMNSLPVDFGNGTPSKFNQHYLIDPLNENGVIKKHSMQHNIWNHMIRFNMIKFESPFICNNAVLLGSITVSENQFNLQRI